MLPICGINGRLAIKKRVLNYPVGIYFFNLRVPFCFVRFPPLDFVLGDLGDFGDLLGDLDSGVRY